MQACRNIITLSVLVAFSFGLVGCGGGPATGDQATTPSAEEGKKKMLEGYLKKMPKPKGQPKSKQ